MTPAELELLRHLDRVGQELFRETPEYGRQFKILREMAAQGWIALEVWPPEHRIPPISARRRFAVARITNAGRQVVRPGNTPNTEQEGATTG